MSTSTPLDLAVAALNTALKAPTHIHPAFNQAQYEQVLACWRVVDALNPTIAEPLGQLTDYWVEQYYSWEYVYGHEGADPEEDRKLLTRRATSNAEIDRWLYMQYQFGMALANGNRGWAWMWCRLLYQEFPREAHIANYRAQFIWTQP